MADVWTFRIRMKGEHGEVEAYQHVETGGTQETRNSVVQKALEAYRELKGNKL